MYDDIFVKKTADPSTFVSLRGIVFRPFPGCDATVSRDKTVVAMLSRHPVAERKGK